MICVGINLEIKSMSVIFKCDALYAADGLGSYEKMSSQLKIKQLEMGKARVV